MKYRIRQIDTTVTEFIAEAQIKSEHCDHIIALSEPRHGHHKFVRHSDKDKPWRGRVCWYCPDCGKRMWQWVEKKDKLGNYKIKEYTGAKKFAKEADRHMLEKSLYRRLCDLLGKAKGDVEEYYAKKLSEDLINLTTWEFTQKYAEGKE